MNKGMLESVFEFLEDTMLVGSSQISEPLLALRHLCAVESHRQMLWSMYAAAVPFTILEALEQAIQDKNLPAMNDATSILAQFANDPEPLAWMRGNTPTLEKAFAQLGPFPEALSAAQKLLRVVEPSF